MRHPRFLARFLVSSSLIISLLVACESFAADTSEHTAAPSFASQADATGISRLPARQPGDSTTLEIAPQPSADQNPPARSEVPAGREFRQSSEDIAALERNFHPENPDHTHNPYLGISVEYSTQCFLGMEENGFEVMTVYPGSPAARAGLQARTPSTPMGDLGALGSILFLPVSVITMPLLRRSGALGEFGDLIVAIDDQRVRSKGELLTALGHLKPGDTTYFTIIRPLPGGSHRTMRIAVHIDREVDAFGNPTSSASSRRCKVNHTCHPDFDPMLRKPFDPTPNAGVHSLSTESAAN
jgi:S1-C subfamily serine protease